MLTCLMGEVDWMASKLMQMVEGKVGYRQGPRPLLAKGKRQFARGEQKD